MAGKQRRLLLVEDSEMYRELLQVQLADADMDVTAVTNGEEALAALEADTFDIVLMDREMPVLNGLEAARRIRGRLGLSELPIICLSGDASEASLKEVTEAGINDLLGKPVPEETLLETLEKWLAVAEGGRCESHLLPAGDSPVMEAVGGAEVTPTPQTDPATEVLDAVHVAASTRQNTALFNRQVQRFLRLWSDFDGQLELAVSDKDPDVVLRLIHNLNSNAALIGANRLSDFAADLERRIRQRQPITDAEFAALSSTLSGVIDALRERFQTEQEQLSDEDGPEGARAPALDSQLLEALSKLCGLIEGHEADALKEVQRLSAVVEEAEVRLRLQRVSYHLQDFDFGAARSIIEQLLPPAR